MSSSFLLAERMPLVDQETLRDGRFGRSDAFPFGDESLKRFIRCALPISEERLRSRCKETLRLGRVGEVKSKRLPGLMHEATNPSWAQTSPIWAGPRRTPAPSSTPSQDRLRLVRTGAAGFGRDGASDCDGASCSNASRWLIFATLSLLVSKVWPTNCPT